MKLKQIFSQSRVIIIIALLVISSVLFLCNLPYYYTEGFDGEESQLNIDTSTSSPATSVDISNIVATPIEINPDNVPIISEDGSTVPIDQVNGSDISMETPINDMGGINGTTYGPVGEDNGPPFFSQITPQINKTGVFKEAR